MGHMVPLLAGIDFIGDHPVGYPTVSVIGIPLRQEGGDGRHILHPRFLRAVEHIIGCGAPASGLWMNELLVGGGIIVQDNGGGGDPLCGEGAENNVVLLHHLTVEGVGPSVVGILDGRVCRVGGRAKEPGHRDIVGGLLYPQIVQLAA